MTTAEVARALAHVFDPELGINVVELGLIYAIDCDDSAVRVLMTTTSSSCPMGPAILEDASTILEARFPGAEVTVDCADSPPWHPGMLGPHARRELGLPA